MPLELFPYQQEGAAWLAQRNRAGLHDEMGVGKTATIIRAIDNINGQRGIIICPALLRENWIGEFRKFGQRPLRYCKGQNIHDFVAWSRGRFDVLITSYEQATKWAPHINEMGEFLDFIAMDEAHFLKNAQTARSKAILGDDAGGADCIMQWAEYAWHVTGTPIPNDPNDIYTFLRFADVMPLAPNQFLKRYFHARSSTYGTRTNVKPEMADELRALIGNNVIRRMQREVYPQLPPIFLTSALVDGDTDGVKELLRQYPGLEKAIVNALQAGGLSFLDSQHVATLRRLIGEAKAIPYAHQLAEELKFTGDKRAVYGVHVGALQTVRDILTRAGIGAVLVNGATPERDRIAYVNAFQQDASVQCFIGNIRAAGAGLTLTAACELDVLESDWSPAGNAQAIKRVHRVGQTRTVRARFITLANSFDVVVNEIVADKTKAIAAIEGEAMNAAPLLG